MPKEIVLVNYYFKKMSLVVVLYLSQWTTATYRAVLLVFVLVVYFY